MEHFEALMSRNVIDMREKLISCLRKQWLELRGVLLFVCILVPMKSSFADWNWVPSGSMNPTIVEGDLVFINKLAYDLRVPLSLARVAEWSDPQKGDISVLLSPDGGTRLVKRVIGTPGDSIEMRDNVLFINGEALEYSELPDDKSSDISDPLRNHSLFATEILGGRAHAVMATPGLKSDNRNFDQLVVPEGQYFVMGDNRDNSRDSRVIGFVERERFLGRAERVLLSFDILDKYQPRWSRFGSRLD